MTNFSQKHNRFNRVCCFQMLWHIYVIYKIYSIYKCMAINGQSMTRPVSHPQVFQQHLQPCCDTQWVASWSDRPRHNVAGGLYQWRQKWGKPNAHGPQMLSCLDTFPTHPWSSTIHVWYQPTNMIYQHPWNLHRQLQHVLTTHHSFIVSHLTMANICFFSQTLQVLTSNLLESKFSY